MCASQSQRQVSFSVVFYTTLLGQGLLLNPKLTDWLDWLVNSSCLLAPASPVPGLQPHAATPGFLTLVLEICTQDPHACAVSTLLSYLYSPRRCLLDYDIKR